MLLLILIVIVGKQVVNGRVKHLEIIVLILTLAITVNKGIVQIF